MTSCESAKDEPEQPGGWPVTVTPGVGRSHGTSRNAPFDRWFRYPAGFASDYVAVLLDQLSVERGSVVDCFAGSGVTGTAARHRGLNFFGIEAHPLIAELASLKLDTNPPSPAALRAAATVATAHVRTTVAATPTRDLQGETDLVTRSFAADVLRNLVELRGVVKGHPDAQIARYLKWALLATLREVATVKVGWPYQRPGVARTAPHRDVLQRFAKRVDAMAEDLNEQATSDFSFRVVNGDAGEPGSWSDLEAHAQACVSSPPYLNNFDYADATRLELYFWGEVTTWRAMCDEVRHDMVTATTQQSSKAEQAAASQRLETDGGAVGAEVIGITKQLSQIRQNRAARSKEYDQVVPPYFTSMWDVLTNLHRHLEPGAPAVWLVGDSAPYGVYVDTPAIIGRFAELVGFELKEDVLLRQRGNRWAKNGQRASDVQLSERALVLRRP